MSKLQQRFFTFLPAFILLVNQIIIMFIRPTFGQVKYGFVSDVLGWLPNYLAPLGFVTLGMLLIILLIELKIEAKFSRFYNIYMIFISVIALIGFIWWEYIQKRNSLVFDIADIYATICGVLTGYLIFLLLYVNRKLTTQ